MGEAALSSVVVLEEEEDDVDVEESKMVRWERFLPRMSLGVLLVEGDDSTRQIITALLRKCNYKVAAVPDGLRAWEVLKEKAHNIDIILTEVDLPSVSGYSLLTMIMGHENCKSIPVIMMSSHDSISVVFKCMLAGAADFLIKPIRKNELRNLWQHVWRREASSDLKRRHQDGNLVPQNFNTTENLAASNHSSACMQKDRECSEKGSDAQSSCTKPDTEAESEYMHNTWQLLQPKPRNASLAMDTSMHEGDTYAKLVELASEEASCKQSSSTEIFLLEKRAYTGVVRKGEEVALPKFQEDANVLNETDCNKKQVEAPREAIDLIGAINYQPQYSYQHIYHTASHGRILNSAENLTDVNGIKCKLSFPPQLELSLRSSQPTGCKSQETEERCTLNHSNASPFSRYNNRTVLSPLLSPENFSTEPRESCDSQKPPPEQSPVDAAGVQRYRSTQSNGQEETNPQVVGADQEKKMLPFHQLGIVPVPVPAGGMPLDNFYAGYGSLLPPIFYPQTHPPGPPSWSANSSSQQEAPCVNSSHQSNPETHDSAQNNLPCDQTADKQTSEAVPVQDQILESEQETRHVPSIAGQSGSSTLCTSSRSHLNSNGCGGVCNGSKMTNTTAAAGGAPSEGGNGEGLLACDGVRTLDYQRFSQREAALTKFRLKRKDRCFEKKVRYQSRKRLAEQRPRVKGQFVRQVQPDPHPPSVETD